MDHLKKISTQLSGQIRKQDLIDKNFNVASTRELIVKDYSGFKINGDEFGELLQININVDSDIILAINHPENNFKINQLINVMGFEYNIYIVENQYSPFLYTNFNEFWSSFSKEIRKLKLSKKEFIFIDGYRFCLVLELRRDIVLIIDDFINLINSNDSFFSKNKQRRLYKKNIPNSLVSLFPLLNKWGLSDDHERENLIEKIERKQKEILIAKVAPLMVEINRFLDSFGDRPLSEEAIKISNLAELVSELMLK